MFYFVIVFFGGGFNAYYKKQGYDLYLIDNVFFDFLLLAFYKV